MADIDSVISSGPADDQPAPTRNAPSEATLLGSYDVFALIVNKMIGTGIYTAPSTVLLYTGSKRLSLGLWGVGFFYTIMSTFIYLDYAAVFPYTGGELVYIDEVTSANSLHPQEQNVPGNPLRDLAGRGDGRHRNGPHARPQRQSKPSPIRVFFGRVLGDGLLAYTVYAFLFVGLFNSGTNVLQVGREILISIKPEQDPNRDLVRFIGVVTISIICLIQLFSSRAGRVLNGFFALVKILFLLVLFFFGVGALRSSDEPSDFTQEQPDVPTLNYAQGILVVLYSYEGWENANFVAGEISSKNPSTLRRGFLWAVAVVGILYMALNAVFLSAIPYKNLVQIRNAGKQVNYAALFSNDSTAAQRAWAIIVALSSFGNANTVTYTFTRVKQSIGFANILPWSSLWKKDYLPQGARSGDRYKTPLGGLLLEWIVTVIIISVSASIPSTLGSVNLPGNLQTYAHCFILVILGLGLFRLRKRENDLEVEVKSSWFPRISHAPWLWKGCFIFLYCSMNLFILIINAISNSGEPDNPKVIFDGRWYPTVVLALLGLSLVYYWTVFAAYVPEPFWNWSILQLAGSEALISKEPKFNLENEEARRFGHRRSIYIRLMGGDAAYWRACLFWFFGGSLIQRSPVEVLEDAWIDAKRIILTGFTSVKTRLFSASRQNTESPQGVSDEEIEMQDQ